MSWIDTVPTDHLSTLSIEPFEFLNAYPVRQVIIGAFMIVCSVITAVITHIILKRCRDNDEDDRSIRLFQFVAFANMMAGLSISIVFMLSDPEGKSPYTAVVCQIGKTFIYVFNFQATVFVTAITVNRFLHVKWPLQYYRVVSLKKINLIISMILLISTVYCVYLPLPSFPFVGGLQPECFGSPYLESHQQIITLVLLLMWSINHVIILGTNILLLKITHDVRRSRRIAAVTDKSHSTATGSIFIEAFRGTNRSTRKRQHRGVILVISISVIYFLSCLPSIVVLSMIAAQTAGFSPYVYLGVFLLGIVSSVWNIIAFILFDTKFRRVICGMFKRTTRSEQLVIF